MIDTQNRTFYYRNKRVAADSLACRKYFRDRRVYLACKRTFDIVFSSLIVVFILSWLFPLVALLIKFSSKGPVLFIQKRVGFLGKTFHCYKFRTMVVNKDANTRQAVEGDPRITRIGEFLRKTNLDEFPQFINVLKGDMSLIGPRPHMHKDCRDFSNHIANYKFRNIARPGVTGLAQVKGFRGPATDFDSIVRRYQWDSFYVRNMGFRMDMRILRLTITSTIVAIFRMLFSAKKEKECPVSFTSRSAMGPYMNFSLSPSVKTLKRLRKKNGIL